MSPFETDQVFKSRKDLIEWVQNIARGLGYVIVTKRSKTKPGGYVKKVILSCDRGGVYRSSKNSSRATGTKKINCPFELVANFSKINDCWSLIVKVDIHNHDPAEYLEGHPYARRLTNEETQLVEDLTRKHVAPRDILGVLKDRNEKNVSTLKTIYNARDKIRSTSHEGKSHMEVLMEYLKDKEYKFDTRINKSSNKLEALFFVHPISFDLLCAFPHVLMLDATYKTNKYNMPFLEIVGVTSTKKTFCMAFAFMHDETTQSYFWVLNCLKSILDPYMQPRVIVTDRELALMNACEHVFPNATRLLCRWHIYQSIFKKCRRTLRWTQVWESFMSKWDLLINSQTLTSYTHNYEQLQSMLVKHQGVLRYLDETWLKPYKERFVSFWIDQCLHFGNDTNNRAESQHAKLKKYLDSSNCTLEKFIGYIDEIVKSQYTSIKESFEKSKIILKHNHNLLELKLLHGAVSHKALNIIKGEMKLDPLECGCQVRKSCGLPCACEMSKHLIAGQCIQLHLIDVFWKKLNMSPFKLEDNDEVTCEVELKQFENAFNNQSKLGKLLFLEKLKEIYDPSIPLVEEPVVKKNTRGRPSLKKQEQKSQLDSISHHPRKRNRLSSTSNPIEYNFMGLKPSPPRSTCTTMPQVVEYHFMGMKPSSPPTDCSSTMLCSHSLMKEIPEIFHPYIRDVVNVDGDGNCGFRSVAVCLGLDEDRWPQIRHELLDELQQNEDMYRQVFATDFDDIHVSLSFVGLGNAPYRNWMIMPDTSILIANRYDVIVNYMSKDGYSTCFPLWKGPDEIQDHRVLNIARVNGNHYVMVLVEGECPLPTITHLWSHYKRQSAIGWKSVYDGRLRMYTDLLPTKSEFIDLSLN